MSYIVRVNGAIIGIQVLTTEDVKKYNKDSEISLEKVLDK